MTVLWDGRPREIVAYLSDTTPLIGMSLLHGHKLEIDVEDGGAGRHRGQTLARLTPICPLRSGVLASSRTAWPWPGSHLARRWRPTEQRNRILTFRSKPSVKVKVSCP